jgi:Flp pilus assembly protein TadB
MKRSFVLAAISLILFGVAFAWQSSNADDEKVVATIQTEADGKQLELIDRINALEKRLEKLEADSTSIRQADHQEMPAVPTPGTLPPAAIEEDPEVARKTNGQTWRIRMLGHRRSAEGPR